MLYDNILGTIGRTPIVRINRLAPAGTTMYVKCEFFNPLSSVKDRLAIAIIEDAERTGALKPGQTVVEATSGNTGIALAMVCAAKGYPFVAVMVETFSIERRKIMRMLGAKVILTPAAGRGQGMVAQGRRARAETRLVPGASVRKSRQPRLPPQHHGSGNHPGLRRQASRSLRHRLGHGRHAHRRRRSAQARAPGHQGHRLRAGSRTVVRWQAVRAAQDPGLDAGFRAGSAESQRRRSHRAGSRRRGHRGRARAGQERGHFRRHLERRHFCRGGQGGARSRARARSRSPCCPDTGERYLSTALFEGISDGGDPEP